MKTFFDADVFYSTLDKLFAAKNIIETERFLKSEFNEYNSSDCKEGIIAVCNELGAIYRVKGMVNEAKNNYDRVLRELRDLNLQSSSQYANALINYGDVFIVEGDNRKALELFNEALNILQNIGGNEYGIAALHNNLSVVYKNLGMLDMAEASVMKALLIIKSLSDSQDEIGTSFINLAEIQLKRGKNLLAKENFMKALEIFYRDGGKSVHTSVALSGLGNANYALGEYDEAVNSYEKALELLYRDFGESEISKVIKQNLSAARSKLMRGI